MGGAPELLHHLRGAGLVLTLTPAGGLHVAPRSALTDDYRAAIRAGRDALVLALLAEALAESIEERAAIREYDGGEPRHVAEQEARSAMRVYEVLVAMPEGRPARWVAMLAPGCDLTEARRAARHQFGPERVLILTERP